ncbi:MAG: hypothetical protein GY723_12860 [bacterium]|nr:hypothetical protein [bacterium]MCP5068051.1 hypothetical protein [bacterium]
MSSSTLRRFLRSWHWIWVVAGSSILGLSLWLRDARPMLVAFWWMGFVLLGLIMLAGIVGAFVMMVVGIRQNLAARKKRKKAGTA